MPSTRMRLLLPQRRGNGAENNSFGHWLDEEFHEAGRSTLERLLNGRSKLIWNACRQTTSTWHSIMKSFSSMIPTGYLPRGATGAAPEAKKAGKIRYIGFTGHKDPTSYVTF